MRGGAGYSAKLYMMLQTGEYGGWGRSHVAKFNLLD